MALPITSGEIAPISTASTVTNLGIEHMLAGNTSSAPFASRKSTWQSIALEIGVGARWPRDHRSELKSGLKNPDPRTIKEEPK